MSVKDTKLVVMNENIILKTMSSNDTLTERQIPTLTPSQTHTVQGTVGRDGC